MPQRDESELIAYLAENPSGARLVLRDAPDSTHAVAVLRAAAGAVSRIPHPDEPSWPLPNWCSAFMEDGLPVLCLDVKDRSDYAGRIAAAILGALDADGIGGRLEPFPRPFTPPPPPTEPYVRPEPRTVSSLLGRIVHEPGHPLLPLRAHPEGLALPDDMQELAHDDRVTVDDTGLARLTELGRRDVDDHMRRKAAQLGPLLDGIEAARRAAVRDSCLRMAGIAPEMLDGWRGFFGPLEPDELLALETFYALTAAQLGGMMPKRAWFDERWLAMLRLHRVGADGVAESELPDLDEFDGAVTRSGGVVRLTERGRQAAARYLEALGGDPEIYDVCWWIVRNFRRALP